MKNYRTILSRVGLVLVMGGFIDIGVMIYCIVNQMGYSSSFNIFAVIAGVFLIKGNLKAARIVALFAAFFLSGFFGGMVIAPFLFPFDLLMIYFKLEPTYTLFAAVLITIIMILLAWVYRELTSPSVRAAMDEAQVNYSSFWRKPAKGFWIGGCLAIALFVFVSLLMRGTVAAQAKQRAAAQVGPSYKLHVRSLTTGGKHIHAVVIAYNDKEIKNVVIDWTE